MTGFPIAVGTGPRHSSSRPFPQHGRDVIMAMGVNDDETLAATVFINYNFHPIDETTEEERYEIDVGDSGQEINDRNAAAAAPSASSIDGNHQFNVIAELRVQISHSSSPLVSNTDAMSNRETKSRVPLGIMKKRRQSANRSGGDDDKTQQLFIPAASVIFSSNQSHLACLIPVPTGYELISNADSSQIISRNESVSTIVIFNIQTYTISSRQQMRQRNRKLPKLPDYILDQTTNKDDTKNGGNSNTLQSDGDHVSITSERQSNDSKSQNDVYVAHVPKIVRVAQREGVSPESDVLPSLQSATCICNAPSDSSKGKGSDALSMLLVGITNGSLLIIDFETARVKDILYEQKQMDRVVSPIIHLSQCPPTQWKPHNKYGDELGSASKGRISAVTRDGGITIFNTTFHGVNELHSSNSIDQSKSFVNKSGLIMQIEYLAEYHPSQTNNSSYVSGLRYACAKWLNPLLLAVLTRSPLLDNDSLEQSVNTLSDVVVAQVWSVTEVQDVENPEQTRSKSNICVLSELKFPCENSLVEQAHGTFSLSQEPVAEGFGKSYSIAYNSHRDCLAISSQLMSRDKNAKESTKLKVRPICISWDWKRNFQGLTLISDMPILLGEGHAQPDAAGASSIFSQFLVSNDCAVHYHEKRHAQRKLLHKDIYNLSTLSPSSVSGRGSNVRLCEVSPLMLGGDVITYPLISQPLATSDVSLRWEESKIPSSYVAANGPCRIAAIGKDRGRSIAVAASRGLCILDLSRTSWENSKEYKIATPCIKSDSDVGASTSQLTPLCPQWKLFSNINDEQQFRTLTLTWWESSTEDFIFAVVQFVTSDAPHLVCWSHKRLGFGENQLLIDHTEYISKRDEGAKSLSSHGLPLPDGLRVDSMSILRDPGSDRALLLLSSISSDVESCGIDYALYQLQTRKQTHMTSERILAKLSTHGNIPLTVGTVPGNSITGVFLAGGSFLFDLGADQLESEDENFGVIGITSFCLDLCVAYVNRTGPILYKPSFLDPSNIAIGCSLGTKMSIIASYWISDTSPGRIVWNISKNDGEVYCWAAPCYNGCTPAHNQMAVESSAEKQSMIGDICCLGRSSQWQNGSTLNENEVALGPFLSHFSCTMYSGQTSRTMRLQSDAKAILAFYAGNCLIAAPHYTPSLFVSFLNLAKQNLTSSKSQPNRTESIEKSYIRMTLLNARNKNNGSCRSALRIIILKVVDLLDESKDNQDRIPKWNEAMSILREVVSVAREIFDELSFASFFLSVGRQLEPHQFDLIFPLPLDRGEGIPAPLDRGEGISAEDLFVVAAEKGSMSVALSGLSLFTCHQETQNRVVQLLFHCLFKVDKTLALSPTFSSEEGKFLHQLYWFGVKLEDAIIEEQVQDQEESKNIFDSIDSDESSSSFTISDESSVGYASNGDYSVDLSEDSSGTLPAESQDASFISCRSQNQKPKESLVTKVVSRLFLSSEAPKNNSFEEDAIYEAATSFIISGFDYDEKAIASSESIGIASTESNDIPSTESSSIRNGGTHHFDRNSFDTPFISVAGSTCAFLSHAIGFNYKPTSKAGGWITMSKIACLIQGDRETLAISHAAASNAVRISQLVTVDELRDVFMRDQPERASEQSHIKVASFLKHLNSQCCDEIHSYHAVESILNLILLLLLRHDICEDVQLNRGTLILIGIVCGHRSGRITNLINTTSHDCDVHRIYQAFTQQYN